MKRLLTLFTLSLMTWTAQAQVTNVENIANTKVGQRIALRCLDSYSNEVKPWFVFEATQRINNKTFYANLISQHFHRATVLNPDTNVVVYVRNDYIRVRVNKKFKTLTNGVQKLTYDIYLDTSTPRIFENNTQVFGDLVQDRLFWTRSCILR